MANEGLKDRSGIDQCPDGRSDNLLGIRLSKVMASSLAREVALRMNENS